MIAKILTTSLGNFRSDQIIEVECIGVLFGYLTWEVTYLT